MDFEYCAVMQTETKSFTLVNTSSSLLQFEIVIDKDNTTFEIEPTTGMLRSGHKQEIKIHYKPLEAKVVLSTAVFKFQEGDKTA
jgi:hypothetical protein